MAPGSIVKVTPSGTPTGPVSMYGLLALVQVVSELITPIVSVAASTVPKTMVPANVENKSVVMKAAVNSVFLFTDSPRSIPCCLTN